VHIVPGVRWQAAGAAPDVMRGEETRAFGTLQHDPAWQRGALLVLPGTHSKWVTLRDGRIDSLATYMTGELFAVLRTHSILGRLMPEGTAAQAIDAAAFLRGVAVAQRAGAAGDLLHDLFSVRTLGLMQQLPASSLADYLSGLLIGNEVVATLAHAEPTLPVVLGGEAVLCERYARALDALQRAAAATLQNTAPQGLWALARASGLVTA
jgi:2-dehydro-3-deoxygalactonokinase